LHIDQSRVNKTTTTSLVPIFSGAINKLLLRKTYYLSFGECEWF